MKFLQNAVLAALKRVQLFIDAYAAVLAALLDLTAARKCLDAVVASFNDHAYNQDATDRGVKGETAKQYQLRVRLRGERMEPIALIARKNLRSTPEFVALQMPKPTVRGEAFLASATAVADAAAIHKDIFIAHGMPKPFSTISRRPSPRWCSADSPASRPDRGSTGCTGDRGRGCLARDTGSNHSNHAARRGGLTRVLCGRWPVVRYRPPATHNEDLSKEGRGTHEPISPGTRRPARAARAHPASPPPSPI